MHTTTLLGRALPMTERTTKGRELEHMIRYCPLRRPLYSHGPCARKTCARTIVLDAILKEVDKVAEAWRPSKGSPKETSRQPTPAAAEVDVRVDWTRAGTSLDAYLWQADEGDDITNRCQDWVQCEVVAADRDQQRVLLSDTPLDEAVLRQEAAA